MRRVFRPGTAVFGGLSWECEGGTTEPASLEAREPGVEACAPGSAGRGRPLASAPTGGSRETAAVAEGEVAVGFAEEFDLLAGGEFFGASAILDGDADAVGAGLELEDAEDGLVAGAEEAAQGDVAVGGVPEVERGEKRPISNSKARMSTREAPRLRHSGMTSSTNKRPTRRLMGPTTTRRLPFLPRKKSEKGARALPSASEPELRAGVPALLCSGSAR